MTMSCFRKLLCKVDSRVALLVVMLFFGALSWNSERLANWYALTCSHEDTHAVSDCQCGSVRVVLVSERFVLHANACIFKGS